MTRNVVQSTREEITVIQQASPLLNLPAEIRNEIFEPGLPTATTIILSAQVQHRAGGTTTYVFRPALPPLYAVCRQLRVEFIARYYAENTFRLAHAMFQHNALAAFIAGRMPAIVKIRSVQANQWCQIVHGVSASAVEQSIPNTTIRFKASMDATGVNLDEVLPRPDRICCCTLREAFEDAADPQSGQRPKSLAVAPYEYGRAIDAYEVRAESQLTRDGPKSCIRCRLPKGFRDTQLDKPIESQTHGAGSGFRS